jgi:hypothetical protein
MVMVRRSLAAAKAIIAGNNTSPSASASIVIEPSEISPTLGRRASQT